MTHIQTINLRAAIAGLFLSVAASLAGAAGFSSGSTGVDGAFSPTANTTLTLPPSGVFNFTSVNIPAGVTVNFIKNTANTPVVILATGNVTIAGVIDVSGGASLTSGGGLGGDRSVPGSGGPGGYDGGRGGAPETNRRAGNGTGPGGGGGGDAVTACCSGNPQGGGGGGYGLAGNNNAAAVSSANTGIGGGVYGSNLLTPLVGGSGGGGGAGAAAVNGFQGTGGGGGGGTILIAATGTVTLSGSILANGGVSGDFLTSSAFLTSQHGATGGGGSGGAIRIVASNTVISGTLNVNGGAAGTHGSGSASVVGGAGGRGRANVEVLTAGTLNLAGLPMLAITSVAGVAAPAVPSGAGDVILPAATPNPATVVFATSGIPVGNTVKLTVTPARGAATTATSPPLAGSLSSATASVDVTIPSGTSTLIASTSYTISVAMGEALSRFANNERVERITLTATLGGPQQVKLTTVSGREYEAPAEVLQIAALGG